MTQQGFDLRDRALERLELNRLPLRFWSKVRVLENGCWEWTAGCRGGYGNFRVGSLKDHSRRSVIAHRFAYMALIGPIPDGLEIDHLCRR